MTNEVLIGYHNEFPGLLLKREVSSVVVMVAVVFVDVVGGDEFVNVETMNDADANDVVAKK